MRRKNVNLAILMFTVILLGLSFYIISSMFWTTSSIKFESTPTLSSISSLKNLAAGGTISLSSEDINSLLKLYLPKPDNKTAVQPEAVSCSMKDNKISFYASVKYHSFKLVLSTRGTLECDNTALYYYPDYFKAGKLTIPKSLAYKLLKNYAVINAKENRIEIEKSKLPIEIESLELKENLLKIKLGKIKSSTTKVIPSTEKQAPSTEKPGTQTPSNNLNNALLSRTSTQLKKVSSAAKTAKEKEIVQLIQNTVNKMTQNENYSYDKDAAAVMTKYSKLTSTEKNDIKDAILNNMDIETLIKLKDTFGL